MANIQNISKSYDALTFIIDSYNRVVSYCDKLVSKRDQQDQFAIFHGNLIYRFERIRNGEILS